MVKLPPASAGDTGSIPSLGRPHGPGATEPKYHTTAAWVVWGLSLHRRPNDEKPLQLESGPCSP